MSLKNKYLIQFSTLAVFAFVLYWPCINTYFFSDDLIVFEGSGGLLNSPKSFFSAFTDAGVSGSGGHTYRPIYRLTAALMCKLFGLNPTMYHIQNIIFHVLSAVLVYFLALTLTNRSQIAYLSSLFFTVHYASCYSTAIGIANARKLALLFLLMAVILYIRWRRSEIKTKLYYILSVLFYLMSMLSIDEAIMLVAVLIVYEVCLQPQKIWCHSSWLKLLPFAITAVFYIAIRKSTGTMMPHLGESAYAFTVNFNILSNMIYYILNLISPVDIYRFIPFLDQLQATVAAELENNGVLKWSILFVTSIGVLVGGIVIGRQVGGLIRFLLLWILLFLLPCIMLRHPSHIYLAFPSVGYVIFLSIILCNVVHYLKQKEHYWVVLITYTFIVLLIIGYSLSTFHRSIMIDTRGDTAEHIISQVQSKYPTFQDGVELYFANEEEPKTYSFIGLYGVRVFETYGIGPWFRTVYANPSIKAHIVSIDELYQLRSLYNFSCGKHFFVYHRDGKIEEILSGW